MKIGILYICTGNYSIFWDEFFYSCEKFFLPEVEKKYYVFTDAKHICGENLSHINKVYQENLGWPDNTLMRFQMFNSISDRLTETDYLFFFNANILFVRPIDQSFLPVKENLAVVIHPGFKDNHINEFPYERNPQSLAYIPFGKGKIYVQGALNGGKTTYYLDMINILHKNISEDKANNIIAIWHDESHLNHYILDRTDIKVLGPEYVNQEDKNYGVTPMIISRNKDRYMNIDDLRGIHRSNYDKLVICLKRVFKKILGRDQK